MFPFKPVALAATILIFIMIDMVWLGLIANRLYFKKLSYLAQVKNNSIVFNLPIGILTQAIIAAGLFVTISLAHALGAGPSVQTVAIGAFVSFAMYATYDLTSLSFVKDWPLDITLIDLAWGTLHGVLAGIYIPFLLSRL